MAAKVSGPDGRPALGLGVSHVGGYTGEKCRRAMRACEIHSHVSACRGSHKVVSKKGRGKAAREVTRWSSRKRVATLVRRECGHGCYRTQWTHATQVWDLALADS
eukprot:1111716-Pelagomonas_calceolata.AAC.1